MESVVVTTVAGNGDRACIDGFGTHATFSDIEGMRYCGVSDSLLVAESGLYSHRIRRIYPVTERRKTALKHALNSALNESGALPVHSLILIIFDFAIGEGTVRASFSCKAWRFPIGGLMFGVLIPRQLR